MHLSPNRPLAPGDAYEADVELAAEAAGNPGVCGDIPLGWLLRLLLVRRPAPPELLLVLGGPRQHPLPRECQLRPRRAEGSPGPREGESGRRRLLM